MSTFKSSVFVIASLLIVTLTIYPTEVKCDSVGLARDCHLNQVKENPRNVNSFYWCLPDGPVLMKCVDTLVFDPIAKKCITKKQQQQRERRRHEKLINSQDHKINKVVSKKPFFYNSSNPNSSPNPPSKEDLAKFNEVQCPIAYHSGRNAATIYYPSPNSCKHFYVCSNGSPEVFQCPRGLSFNPAENVCDWSRNVPGCGLQDTKSTHPKSSPVSLVI